MKLIVIWSAVLIILDRNLDLIPMVAHTWSYQALVNDVLEIKLNRVTVDVSLRLSTSNQVSSLTKGSLSADT